MPVTLHKPSVKLAGFYLAVMMVISLFFSGNVYQLSMQEFNRGFRMVPKAITALPSDLSSGALDKFREQVLLEQNQRYAEAKGRVLARLVFTNVVILVGGGIVSYYLARRTLQPIEEVHEAQNRFTADASHELRTPLAVMQTETEVSLLNPHLTLPQAKTQLRSNLEELSKLIVLAEGLLRLAQLEQTRLQQQPLDAGSLLQQAIDRVLPSAEAKHILITTDIASDLTISGEELSLVEALVILLDNAIKYSPPTTEITVRANATAKHAVIAVEDQGAGIKASELPYIFERFYQADNARSKQQRQGYGLGLAIADHIVELHHGKLSVASEPGRGSTFTMRLPLAPDHA